MADRKAIVAGSVSYIEIGAAGGTTDYLDIGPAGITGTSGYGTMNIRVNQDGVGDKTMVIGEQGSTTAGNVVHFFGSTDALTTGTVKIHGNLQVDGTENVAGNATFESNATFEGNTTFGNANTDWVSFVADVNSNIRFDANTGSIRSITIEAEAGVGNAGTDLQLAAGDAETTYGGAGADVYLIPAGGGGVSRYGAVYFGNTSAVGTQTGYEIYANNGGPGAFQPGIRYDDLNNVWQIQTDTAGWTNIASGSVLPSGSLNQIMQNDGAGNWVATSDLTFPDTGNRTIDVDQASGVGERYSFSIIGQSGTSDVGGSAGGHLILRSGAGTVNGQGGTIYIQGGNGAGTGTDGNITIGQGLGPYDGVVSIGTDDGTCMVQCDVGNTTNYILASSGTNISGDVNFGSVALGAAQVDFQGVAGTRVVSDIVFDDTTSRSIYVEANATVGQALTVVGGAGTTSGGAAGVYGGAATTGTAGTGGVYGGAATTGTGGDVELVPGGGTTAYGNTLCGGTADTASYFLFRTTAASTPSKAAGPGFRYDDAQGYMEVYNPDTPAWERIASGGDVLPTGAATGEILEWDQTGTQWIVVQDLALPDGAARTISMKDHTAATAAYALTVEGQNNTSVGPGTTTGGQLTVKGGDSTAENGGDLLLAGGVGSGANGDILFGDGTNPFNIDFHYSSGNRIISDLLFANTGTGTSYTLKPDNAASTNGNGMILQGANGGTAATGGNGGGVQLTGGTGGPNNAGGTSGAGGNANLTAGPGGAGATGTSGQGGSVNITAGAGGTLGTVAGAQGGTVNVTSGAGTGNLAGGSMNLTAGAAVGTATAGNMLITAGANSSTGTGGYVQITGGASTGGTAGSLILDAGAGSTNGSISIGGTNATTIQFGQGANTFDMTVGSSPPVLSASGTATIDLPGTAAATNNFRIQGVAVSNNVDAPNLGTLTAGPTSDASALHTHSGLGNSFTKEAGEALNNGALVSVARESTDSNNPKAWNCDTSSSPADDSNSPIPAGFTQAAYADGATATVVVAGEVDVPSGQWTGGIPAKTSIGSLVYASATDGQVTLTPPASGTGLYRTKVGILTDSDAATTTKILVQIGDPLLMA